MLNVADKPSKREKDKNKASGRLGRPINVWVDQRIADALSDYMDSLRPRPTITSVIEVALEDFLRAQGFPPAD